MPKQIIHTDSAPAAIGPYSQATLANGWLYVSGQLPADPATGELVDGPVAEQAHRVLTNVKNVVEAAGGTMDDICKVTVFLRDLSAFVEMNDVYAAFFTANPPARACVEVSRLPKDVDVEMDAFAFLDDGAGTR